MDVYNSEDDASIQLNSAALLGCCTIIQLSETDAAWGRARRCDAFQRKHFNTTHLAACSTNNNVTTAGGTDCAFCTGRFVTGLSRIAGATIYKKLSYRRDIARQLHTSFSARLLMVHFTEHRISYITDRQAKLISTLSANKPCDIRTLS